MAETKVRRSHSTYVTHNKKPLLLTVTIGNANPGGIVVSWNKEITTLEPGVKTAFALPKSFFGERMVVTVLTRDVQSQSNLTSVHVVLATDDVEPNPMVLDLSEDAGVNGGEVLYDIIIDAV